MRGGGGGFTAGGEGLPQDGPAIPAKAAWATSKRPSNPTQAPLAMTVLAVRMYPPWKTAGIPYHALFGFTQRSTRWNSA